MGSKRRRVALILGPLLGLLVVLLEPGGLAGPALYTLAATAWIGTWWILEPIAIPATSLLPLVLLPMTGARPAREVAGLYFNDLIFLLLGGFLLALTLQRWGLHRRLALWVLTRVGTSPRRHRAHW